MTSKCVSLFYYYYYTLVLLISIPIAWAESTSASSQFIQCLNKHSLPSEPISQVIYTPNTPSYNQTLDIYTRNLRFISDNVPKPLVIVAAMHESHVRSTIMCSNQTNWLMKIRSGGHDYEGLSYVANIPFVVLDMFNLRSIDIDLATDTAWVESGAILGELYYNIAEKSKTRAFPAGVCPTVGIGGHFSGGGYGNLIRKYGLSVDNIIDAKYMGLDGIVKDREAMGEDLFWAIRGGCGASFGVILSWKIKLVEVPETVTVFTVNRTMEQGAIDLVYTWHHVVTNLPDDLFIRMELWPIHGYKNTVRATFIGNFLGKSDALLQIMNKQLPTLGLNQNDCIEMKWIESVLYWDSIPRGTPLDTLLDRNFVKRDNFLSKSDFVKEPITKQGWQLIFEKLAQGNTHLQWNPYGGRMNEISESAVPLPQRAGYLCKIQYLLHWNPIGRKDEDQYCHNEIRQVYGFMATYVSSSPREAFINYRDLDIGESPLCNGNYTQARVYGEKYFNRNFKRLVDVKTRVDPTNFFRNEQSIPTSPTV